MDERDFFAEGILQEAGVVSHELNRRVDFVRYSRGQAANGLEFLAVAFGGILFAAVAALVYYRCWSLFCFRCPNRKTVYVKGLELTENAKNVLAGKGEGVFKPIGAPPASAIQYFCNTDMVADPAYRKRIVDGFLRPVSMTLGDFEAYLAKDIPRWEKLIQELGLAAE